MGRNSVRQAQRKSSSIHQALLKGLTFFSPTSQIRRDTLIKMIDVNSADVETHISMGNFFRHRGELDRAIKIHQTLVSRSEIAGNSKAAALFELGRDYVLAGFLERAESLLALLENDSFFMQAQLQLFGIYQTTKEWDRAIELAEKMMQNNGDSDELCQRLAHFYCEQAWRFAERPAAAEKSLQKAIQSDEHAIDPIDISEFALAKQDVKTLNVTTTDPRYHLV